jgi:hypothetical protein
MGDNVSAKNLFLNDTSPSPKQQIDPRVIKIGCKLNNVIFLICVKTDENINTVVNKIKK